MTKLLNMDEAAALFRIKKSTLYDWVHRKKIPYIKLGGKRGRTHFIEEQLIEFIMTNNFQPE